MNARFPVPRPTAAEIAALCQRALDRAAAERIAAVERSARNTIDALGAERAAQMVLRPVMIPHALGLGHEWPVPNWSYGDLIAKARRRLGVAHRHPIYFVTGDLIDLQAAARAVEIIAVEGDRLPAARRVA